MPRGGKRGGARAPSRNVPRLRSGRGTYQPLPNQAIGTGSTEFTLQDEARSTAHRSSPWSSDSRLRHRPVTFVSTGATEPLKQLEEDILHNAPATQTGHKTPATILPTPPDVQLDILPHDDAASPPDKAQLQNEAAGRGAREFAVSLTGDGAVDTTGSEQRVNHMNIEAQPAGEAPAALPFFIDVTGNRNLHCHTSPVRLEDRSPSPAASDSSEEVILFKGRKRAARDREKAFNLHGIRTEIRVVEETVTTRQDRPMKLAASHSLSLTRGSRRDMREQRRREEDELIADYIGNMLEHGDNGGLVPADTYCRRDLGGSLSESESIEESSQTVTPLGISNPKPDGGSEPESETDSVTEGSDAERVAGKSGQTTKGKRLQVDDALVAVLETDASYLGSHEQSHAEDASPQSETSDQEGDEDEIFTAAADRFANEVDDYDFMDWERPSLQRKKGKGAKGKIPSFDISDSELEGKMQAAWKNDRLKKAERKKERQALRAQGLLGKHANPEDLRVKYSDGMALEQIADELRAFLLGSQAILMLPPMDNHARKVIHELASKFNIKSKSAGSGDQRRPMLHRTFRTAKFAEETFDRAIARVGRKYFPRNDVALRAAVQRQSARRGGGGSGHAGVNYRDGEVVGGSAPELGQENKGRAMLEKMGWSSGTALGALNNKGILQPVAQVVKRSKAGLG